MCDVCNLVMICWIIWLVILGRMVSISRVHRSRFLIISPAKIHNLINSRHPARRGLFREPTLSSMRILHFVLAWEDISLDAVTGTGQSSAKYWKRAEERFKYHLGWRMDDLMSFFGEQDFNVDWQRAAATLLVAIGSHDPDLVYLLHNHYTSYSWINLLYMSTTRSKAASIRSNLLGMKKWGHGHCVAKRAKPQKCP